MADVIIRSEDKHMSRVRSLVRRERTDSNEEKQANIDDSYDDDDKSS